MAATRTILCPIDFSDSSCYAFRMAAVVARDLGARLIVLHVCPAPRRLVAYGEASAHFHSAEYEEELWDLLKEFDVPDGQVPIEHRLARGDIVLQILDVAKETGSDMIVLGSRGRTGLERLLLGSIAEHVLRKAPCAVITVKAPSTRNAGTPALNAIAGACEFSKLAKA